MNKGKAYVLVSGRSIASFHITWCQGIIYTRRGMSQRLFSRCMIYRVVGLPRLCLRWLEGSVNHALQRATLRSTTAPFQCTAENPEERFYVALSKNPRSLPQQVPTARYDSYVFILLTPSVPSSESFLCLATPF